MISEIIYHHYKYIQKVMLFIVILSTDILECEEFNPPVDSFDELTEASTIPTIEETDACSFHWTQALWRKVGSYLTLLLVRSIR